ncbi:MAG: HAD family hydrolase [Clostridia bacterium]|nr:HAD family hydrolase [Clostridia bacterium]
MRSALPPVVVFDLYGTLVDIHTDEADPLLWQETAACLGRPWDALALRRAVDRGTREAFLAAGDEFGEPDLARVWQRLTGLTGAPLRQVLWFFRERSTHVLRCFPDARQVLAALRASGRRLILLSNAQACWTRPELRLLGLADAFDGILLSSEVGVRKPSPAFYGTLGALGVSPSECVMVGNDAQCDCWGAHRCGIPSLYLHTRQSPPRTALPPDCREIGGLSELVE